MNKKLGCAVSILNSDLQKCHLSQTMVPSNRCLGHLHVGYTYNSWSVITKSFADIRNEMISKTFDWSNPKHFLFLTYKHMARKVLISGKVISVIQNNFRIIWKIFSDMLGHLTLASIWYRICIKNPKLTSARTRKWYLVHLEKNCKIQTITLIKWLSTITIDHTRWPARWLNCPCIDTLQRRVWTTINCRITVR